MCMPLAYIYSYCTDRTISIFGFWVRSAFSAVRVVIVEQCLALKVRSRKREIGRYIILN